MSSMVAKRVSMRPIFRVGKNQKSLGARSGECGGWVMIGMLARCSSGGNGATSGFCTTITHRTTHRLLCSNFSPRKAFLSSPNHRTLQISLWVTFGFSLLWKWATRGRVSQPWSTSNRMRRLNSGRFHKKPSVGASNNGRIDGAIVCVCAKVLLWRWLGKRCHMSCCYSAIPHFRELFDCPSYSGVSRPLTYVSHSLCNWQLFSLDRFNLRMNHIHKIGSYASSVVVHSHVWISADFMVKSLPSSHDNYGIWSSS